MDPNVLAAIIGGASLLATTIIGSLIAYLTTRESKEKELANRTIQYLEDTVSGLNKLAEANEKVAEKLDSINTKLAILLDRVSRDNEII